MMQAGGEYHTAPDIRRGQPGRRGATRRGKKCRDGGKPRLYISCLVCSVGLVYLLYRRVERRLPIFPRGLPRSIIGAGRLNFRVRDGNGCFPSATVTTPPACTGQITTGFPWWR